ncbi:hypothetical protein STRIP9103_03229, partial [Streptomyces ipomoeae 91-03]
MGGIRTGTWEG